MNFLNQGIPLGRWFGITVALHWTFLLWAFWEFRGSSNISMVVVFLVVVFGCVLLHEFGHCFACRAVGGEAIHILLWPLGGLAFVKPPMTPTAELITVVGGPLVNAVLWALFWAVDQYAMPHIAGNFAPGSQAFRYLALIVD